MLSRKYRPTKLAEVCGQEFAKKALKAILQKPSLAPTTLIFHGEHGIGKTTMARMMAKALNCEAKKRPCGSCDVCSLPSLDSTPYYLEADCAETGQKEDLLELRDRLLISVPDDVYRVVVLDEFHLCSKPAQSTLLKILEELPPRIFVVLCTTQIRGILDTLRSRSIEVPFELCSDIDLASHLVSVINREAIDIEGSTVRAIMGKAGGHVRVAINYLNLYQTLGDTDLFLQSLTGCRGSVYGYFETLTPGNMLPLEEVENRIRSLCGCSGSEILSEIDTLVTDILKCYIRDSSKGREDDGHLGDLQTSPLSGENPYASEAVCVQSSPDLAQTVSSFPKKTPRGSSQERSALGYQKGENLTSRDHGRSSDAPMRPVDINGHPILAIAGGETSENSDLQVGDPELSGGGKTRSESKNIKTTVVTTTTINNQKFNRGNPLYLDSSLSSPNNNDTHHVSYMGDEESRVEESVEDSTGNLAPSSPGEDCKPLREDQGPETLEPQMVQMCSLRALSSSFNTGVLALVKLFSQKWVREGIENPGTREAILWSVRLKFARSGASEWKGTPAPAGRRYRGV